MKKKKNKTYVIHFCHNKECNNGWLDEDLTHVKTFPPKWKYCKKCCEELGIDFDKQLPPKKKSQEEKKRECLNLGTIDAGLTRGKYKGNVFYPKF